MIGKESLVTCLNRSQWGLGTGFQASTQCIREGTSIRMHSDFGTQPMPNYSNKKQQVHAATSKRDRVAANKSRAGPALCHLFLSFMCVVSCRVVSCHVMFVSAHHILGFFRSPFPICLNYPQINLLKF